MSKIEKVVVLEGMDEITAIGNTLGETWENTIAGRSGIARIEPKNLADPRVKIAAQVKDFDIGDHISPAERDAFHRSHAFSVVVSRRVFKNAGLSGKDPRQIGVLIGTGMGGGNTVAEIEKHILEGTVDLIDPFAVQRLLGSRVSTAVAADLGTTGVADTHDAACATANRCFSLAYTMLSHPTAYRHLKAMLVGGVEAAIGPVGLAPFASADMLSILNKMSQTACCPYDEEANGFVMGEGAAVLPVALESFALEHNLPIVAELAGFGNSQDPKKDMFAPDPEGEYMAMEEACEMAKVKPSQIDYVNGHGPGTDQGDRVETETMLRFLGKDSKALVSSTKATTGHALGAASAIEAEMCIMAIKTGIVPPTLNLRNPMVRGLNYVALEARRKRVDITMNNSFGLNGINSVVIFERYRPKTSRTFPNVKTA